METGEGPRPLISVVIPYGDPRRRAEHLATWTREQTLPGDRYEVIVVAVRLAPAEEATVRSYLRPQDRLLRSGAHDPFPMYAEGAEAARAPLLFFSEDHCLADPGCLEETVKYLAEDDSAAAIVRSGNINATAVGRMEQLVNEKNAETWYQDGHWNRLRIRGFAIRQEAYRAAGGFDGQYGHFAEAILAARLHAVGGRVGFVAASGIRHINLSRFDEISHNAGDYTRNESAYADRHDPDFCERYFGSPSLLAATAPTPCAELRRRGTALRAVLGRAIVGGARVGEPCRAWPASTLPTGLGPPPALSGRASGHAWQLSGARVLFGLWWFDEARRLEAFLDFWSAAVYRDRFDYLAAHPRPAPTPLRTAGEAAAEFGAGDLPGPYPVETHQGRTFRWTEPAATIPFDLAPGHYALEIDTAGFRGPAAALPIALLWQGRLLRPDEVTRHGDCIRVTLTPGHFIDGEQWLGVIIPRLPVWGTAERRRLGLPIAAVRITPSPATLPLVPQSLHA